MATAPKIALFGYNEFLNLFDGMIDSNAKNPSGISIALVDIDWFGKINDTYSREIGDSIIDNLAKTLHLTVGDSGQVFRYGGDAFMILFDSLEKEQAFLRIEESRNQFDSQQTILVGSNKHVVDATISCGVAAFPDDGANSNEVIRKCCEALYRAKISGRNKVSLAREEKMVTKTTHYTTGQLDGLQRLAKREGLNEATLLREALDDLLRKHNS